MLGNTLVQCSLFTSAFCAQNIRYFHSICTHLVQLFIRSLILSVQFHWQYPIFQAVSVCATVLRCELHKIGNNAAKLACDSSTVSTEMKSFSIVHANVEPTQTIALHR